MAPVKELGGGFIFLALVSFLARSKPRMPFLGLSLLRNQTETLATQAMFDLALNPSAGKIWNQVMTNSPNVNKLLLMFCDSVNVPPTDFVSFTRSLPVRKKKTNANQL